MKQNYLARFFRVLYVTLIVLVVHTIPVCAQNNHEMTDAEVDSFLDRLSQRASEVSTISARFEQVKKMEMLKSDMVSHGRFLYAKENKVAFLYEKPGKYAMIMNGAYLKMETVSGSSKMDLSANPIMKQMQELITAVFTGSLNQSAGSYDISFSHSEEEIVASVKPRSARLQSIISIISIVFEENSADVKEISVKEGSGSTTKYRFYDQKINQIIDNEIFRIN